MDHLDERLLQQFRTVKDVAKILHLPTWKISRAVRAGIIPSYSLLNGRRLIRINEVLAVLERSREGGAQ